MGGQREEGVGAWGTGNATQGHRRADSNRLARQSGAGLTSGGAGDLAEQLLGVALRHVLPRHHGLQEAVAVRAPALLCKGGAACPARRRCGRSGAGCRLSLGRHLLLVLLRDGPERVLFQAWRGTDQSGGSSGWAEGLLRGGKRDRKRRWEV